MDLAAELRRLSNRVGWGIAPALSGHLAPVEKSRRASPGGESHGRFPKRCASGGGGGGPATGSWASWIPRSESDGGKGGPAFWATVYPAVAGAACKARAR
jgi:hypothetical protein